MLYHRNESSWTRWGWGGETTAHWNILWVHAWKGEPWDPWGSWELSDQHGGDLEFNDQQGGDLTQGGGATCESLCAEEGAGAIWGLVQ